MTDARALSARDDRLACRAWIRTHSKSFFLSSLLLPARVRQGAWALYAFCRRADDAVDEGAGGRRRCGASTALRRRLDARLRAGARARRSDRSRVRAGRRALRHSARAARGAARRHGDGRARRHLRDATRICSSTASASPSTVGPDDDARSWAPATTWPTCAPPISASPCSSPTSRATSARTRGAGASTCRARCSTSRHRRERAARRAGDAADARGGASAARARRRALSRRRSAACRCCRAAAASRSPRAGSSTRASARAIAAQRLRLGDAARLRVAAATSCCWWRARCRRALLAAPGRRRSRSVGTGRRAAARAAASRWACPALRERLSAHRAPALAPETLEHLDALERGFAERAASRSADERRARSRRAASTSTWCSPAAGCRWSTRAYLARAGCKVAVFDRAQDRLRPPRVEHQPRRAGAARRQRAVHRRPRSTRWCSLEYDARHLPLARRRHLPGAATCSTASSTPSACSTALRARAEARGRDAARSSRARRLSRRPGRRRGRSCRTASERGHAHARACSSTAWARPARTPRSISCCPTVGGVLAGLDAGRRTRRRSIPRVGEILVTTEGVEEDRQHIWEGFPGAGRPLHDLPLLLHRAGASCRAHPLLALYERFFATRPRYKRGDAHARASRPTASSPPTRACARCRRRRAIACCSSATPPGATRRSPSAASAR